MLDRSATMAKDIRVASKMVSRMDRMRSNLQTIAAGESVHSPALSRFKTGEVGMVSPSLRNFHITDLLE